MCQLLPRGGLPILILIRVIIRFIFLDAIPMNLRNDFLQPPNVHRSGVEALNEVQLLYWLAMIATQG